jgi:hypothetical protein
MNESPYYQGELNSGIPSGEEKAGLGFAHGMVLVVGYDWEESSGRYEA